MSEYTNERIQKETELESLGFFLESYEYVTGKTFEILEASERPDFICIQDSRGMVGFELAKVRRGHPDDIQWDRIVEKREFMLAEDALEMIQVVGAQCFKRESILQANTSLFQQLVSHVHLKDK